MLSLDIADLLDEPNGTAGRVVRSARTCFISRS